AHGRPQPLPRSMGQISIICWSAGTIETPGALRARGVDFACSPATRRARSRNSSPSEKEYNTGAPPHRQFAPKLEGETCYHGTDSRGQSLATLGGRDGFVCRAYGWPESDWRYFARYSPRQ